MNLVAGKTAGDGVAVVDGIEIPIDRTAAAASSGSVTLGIRPESWRVAAADASGYPVTVAVVEELGADAYVYATPAGVDAAGEHLGGLLPQVVARIEGRQAAASRSDDPPGRRPARRSMCSTPIPEPGWRWRGEAGPGGAEYPVGRVFHGLSAIAEADNPQQKRTTSPREDLIRNGSGSPEVDGRLRPRCWMQSGCGSVARSRAAGRDLPT